jgi:putative transposase
MSVDTIAAPAKSTTLTRKKRWQFQAAQSTDAAHANACGLKPSDSQALAELLSAETLKQLARQSQAADVRERKLTCVVFFWLAVLAFGPGGGATLHQLLSYVVSAMLLAGVTLASASLSKEALSENFRERPWQFFEATLRHLLQTYAEQWQQLAGLPHPLVVEQMQVLLIDSTTMRVATKLFAQFPGRATRSHTQQAGLKLHLSWRLFSSLPEVIALTCEKQNACKTSFLRPATEAVLYIFDLEYWSYQLFERIIAQQQHFLSRLRDDAKPPILAVRQGDPQWVGKRLKEIRLTGTMVDLVVRLSGSHAPERQMQHEVRLIGQWLESDQVWHLYVSSLMDSLAYPVPLLIDLYRLRWQIEMLFRNLKCVLRIANFISRNENGIRIQIYAALIHYVLTQLLILKAMQATGRPLEDFSIPYCLEAVQQVLNQTHALSVPRQTFTWHTLETLLVKALIRLGLRPNRKRGRLITNVKNDLQQLHAQSASPP